MLGAGLTRAVAPTVDGISFGFRLGSWLCEGLGNGRGCALDFRAWLAGSIAPAVDSFCARVSDLSQKQKRYVIDLPASGAGRAAA